MNQPLSAKTDEHWMARALELARQSVGLASPNPAVGCVIVRDDIAVGEGFHDYDRIDHAETIALDQAEGLARGATAYVTLEPCSHHGRTGPCAEALVAAGVKRVVVATQDPNPRVSGRGLARLRASLVRVEVGVLEEEARRINDAFARSIQSHLPFVTLKAGVTLDGRVAPPPGKHPVGSPFWITGEAARAEVQRMRHEVDAVITGINTVLTDDPLLTDRTGLPRRRPLLRVVLDSALRIPLSSQLVRTVKDDLVVFATTPSAGRVEALETLGVRVEEVEPMPGSSRVSLRGVLERLNSMEILSVLLEGGPQVLTSALSDNLVDKISLFCAPRILGSGAVPLVLGLGNEVALEQVEMRRIGNDFAVEGYVRDPWSREARTHEAGARGGDSAAGIDPQLVR